MAKKLSKVDLVLMVVAVLAILVVLRWVSRMLWGLFFWVVLIAVAVVIAYIVVRLLRKR